MGQIVQAHPWKAYMLSFRFVAGQDVQILPNTRSKTI